MTNRKLNAKRVGSVSYTVLHSVVDLLFLEFLESLVNLCIRFMDLKGHGWCHEMLNLTMLPKPHEAPQVTPCTLGELRTRLRNYLSNLVLVTSWHLDLPQSLGLYDFSFKCIPFNGPVADISSSAHLQQAKAPTE